MSIVNALKKLSDSGAFKHLESVSLFAERVDKLVSANAKEPRVYRSWLPLMPQTVNEVSMKDFEGSLVNYAQLYYRQLEYYHAFSGTRDSCDIKDLSVLGNVYATEQMLDHSTVTHEYCTLISQGSEHNSLYSLAQILQHAPALDQGFADGEWTQLSSDLAACSLYHASASLNNTHAMYNCSLLSQQLAKLYPTLSQSFDDLSFKWMERAAVDSNLEQAFTPYAQLLLSKDSLKKSSAIQWMVKAAKLNDASAKLALGNVAVQDQDYVKAAAIWHEAIRTPIDPDKWPMNRLSIADCFYKIACLYFHGRHPTGDSYEYLISDNLEQLYAYKSNVDDVRFERCDYLMAKEFWTIATDVDESNSRAWLNLANMYFDGMIGSRDSSDYELAAFYYEKTYEMSNGKDEEINKVSDGMLSICNHILKKETIEEPLSKIRLFTEKSNLTERPIIAMNNAIHVDEQEQRLHDAKVYRWRHLERDLH